MSKPKPVINHDPHQERPKMHMRDTYIFNPTKQSLEFFEQEVESRKKQHAKILKKHPNAIYIKPPKGMVVINEDWDCPFRVEYRGHLYEVTQGHQMVIDVDSQGYRTVLPFEYGGLDEAINFIDTLIMGPDPFAGHCGYPRCDTRKLGE